MAPARLADVWALRRHDRRVSARGGRRLRNWGAGLRRGDRRFGGCDGVDSFDDFDLQFHFVQDEHEDIVDGAARMRHGEDGFPFQVARVGLHFGERRHAVAMDRHPAIAETPQLVEQEQRIAAVGQHVLVEAEAETPGRRLAGRLGLARRRRLERRAGAGVGEQLAQIGEDADADDGVGLLGLFDLDRMKSLALSAMAISS